MPPLDEGDVLYMPSALPGISAGKVTQLLKQTDRLIKTVPEVASVFGKVGRAETATDPAPLEMFETTIQFKPRSEWRAGMTPEKLVQELDQVVQVPGLTNIWVPPIRNRIDMLATGIKSPIGVKIAGADLQVIDGLARQVEAAVRNVPGVSSAFAERLTGGRYVEVNIDRERAARYGLNISDVQSIVAAAIGGKRSSPTVRLLHLLVRSVRVSGAGHRATQTRRAGHARHYLRAVVPDVSSFQRRGAHYGDPPLCPCRGLLADVPSRLQHVGRFGGGIHCSRRRCGGDRHCHAGVLEPGGSGSQRRRTTERSERA